MTDEMILESLEITNKIYCICVEIVNKVLDKRRLPENKDKTIDELFNETQKEFILAV